MLRGIHISHTKGAALLTPPISPLRVFSVLVVRGRQGCGHWKSKFQEHSDWGLGSSRDAMVGRHVFLRLGHKIRNGKFNMSRKQIIYVFLHTLGFMKMTHKGQWQTLIGSAFTGCLMNDAASWVNSIRDVQRQEYLYYSSKNRFWRAMAL